MTPQTRTMVLGLKRRREKTIIKGASEAEGKQEPRTRRRKNHRSCAIKEGARRKKQRRQRQRTKEQEKSFWVKVQVKITVKVKVKVTAKGKVYITNQTRKGGDRPPTHG